MIGRVVGGNDILALLQARTAKKRPASGTPQTAKEAEAAKALEEKRQRTDEVLRSLTQMTDSMKNERKAAAAQKVERLKKELENLRKFSGGDPKAIARQAARIARELGVAAKEYSSAGGSAPVGVPSSGVPSAGAQDAGAEGAAASDAERVAGGAEAKAGGAEPEAKEKPLSPEEERTAFVDKLNAKLSETTGKSGEAEADKTFENEVRRLFAEAKAILEVQRRRAADQNRSDTEFEQFAKDVEQAGKAIDQALPGGVEPGLIMAQAPVNITV
ncbi:MAG: hypothetical protein H7Z12_01745 [Rhodospirillaceae bacterium]|nr:hypothetical protein [Rhodospirillales bacterium]